MNGSTGGSRPIERHQSIRHRLKGGRRRGRVKTVGSDFTDAILRTADGSDFKSIDDFMLHEVMKVAIDGADQPTTNDVLDQLIEVINHPFDFRKKVSVNMELMQSNVA